MSLADQVKELEDKVEYLKNLLRESKKYIHEGFNSNSRCWCRLYFQSCDEDYKSQCTDFCVAVRKELGLWTKKDQLWRNLYEYEREHYKVVGPKSSKPQYCSPGSLGPEPNKKIKEILEGTE